MNYLAHLFLSGKNPGIRTGNFLGDWFKGKQHECLPEPIQDGVALHRAIDQFADQHPLMKQSYLRLRVHIGRYALPVIDVVQDHFLSLHFQKYSDQPLLAFTEDCIADIRSQAIHLPPPFPEKLATMFTVNWLAKYGTEEGMSRSLANLSKKARFSNKMSECWQYIEQDFNQYEDEFLQFFPEMIQFSQAQLSSENRSNEG